jgi:hypothetical protein
MDKSDCPLFSNVCVGWVARDLEIMIHFLFTHENKSYQYVHLSQWNNSAERRLTINPCQMPEKVALKVFE